MEIQINALNLNVNQRLEDYVQKKLGRLDRYLPNISDVQINLATEHYKKGGDRSIAQLTVRNTRGTILRAEERTTDLFAAIDTVVDKLYRQIERYKGKRKRRGDTLENFAEYETAVTLNEEELQPGVLIRRKQFSTEPMQQEEAIEQMELLGHDFFVFVNAETGGVNVLYQRKDGNYGLLEPEEPR